MSGGKQGVRKVYGVGRCMVSWAFYQGCKLRVKGPWYELLGSRDLLKHAGDCTKKEFVDLSCQI